MREMNSMIDVLPENLYKAIKPLKITKCSKFPVLNYMLITCKDGWLYFITANMDDNTRNIGRCATIIYEEFSICVPMIITKSEREYDNHRRVTHKITTHPFLDFAKLMNDDYKKEVLHLEMEEKTQILKILCDNSYSEFKGIDAQEFPAYDLDTWIVTHHEAAK